jgi:hypothetical protein
MSDRVHLLFNLAALVAALAIGRFVWSELLSEVRKARGGFRPPCPAPLVGDVKTAENKPFSRLSTWSHTGPDTTVS